MIDLSSSAAHGALADDVSRACDPSMDDALREHASALARQGGVIVHIGLGEATGGLDIRRMTLQEIQFIGTYTYTAQDFRDTAQAIFDGRLGTFDWIEKRPLADGWQAFRDIRSGQAEAPKIILEPELG